MTTRRAAPRQASANAKAMDMMRPLPEVPVKARRPLPEPCSGVDPAPLAGTAGLVLGTAGPAAAEDDDGFGITADLVGLGVAVGVDVEVSPDLGVSVDDGEGLGRF
ncbi:hypothetical protein ACIQU6_19930 [Streptomyces sp. NPDC090442]|uniref:hypothetical protein n=1 Tax=Streptomyces sp. NPDC090442 TaxID=3365962 RepID=UPI003827842D